MSKNTRWALALVGVVILIVAAVVIGTNRDSTNATETDEPATPIEQPTDSTPVTGESGATTGGGGDQPNTGGATPDDSGTNDSGGAEPGTGGASPAPDSGDTGGAPAGTSRASAPLLKSGSVKTIKVDKGDTVYFRAKSSTADELHIHGYDKYVELPAGETVNYKFKADIDGVFEIELHGNGEKVAVLKVNP